MAKVKQKLDLLIGKLISRKLLSFFIATHALYSGKINGDQWMFISIIFIGAQATLDFWKIKHGINTNKNG